MHEHFLLRSEWKDSQSKEVLKNNEDRFKKQIIYEKVKNLRRTVPTVWGICID